jgi:hypothetical protein
MIAIKCFFGTERQEIGKQKLLRILIWHIHTAKLYQKIADIYSRS